MKETTLTLSLLLTTLSFAEYEFHLKINEFKNLFSNIPIMQDSSAEERTGIISNGKILASDKGVDWYGEVPASELINGIELSTILGFTTGTNQHSNIGWLHVGIDGKELFIAKKTLRYSVIYQQIPSEAFNGNITIKGQNYKVRMLECSNQDTIQSSGNLYFDSPASHGTEWNRIMYRLTNNVYRDSRNNKNSESPFINLANYSETDLLVDYTGGNGNYTLCTERTQPNGYIVTRGSSGVTYLGHTSTNSGHYYNGWRPVLEKVN